MEIIDVFRQPDLYLSRVWFLLVERSQYSGSCQTGEDIVSLCLVFLQRPCFLYADEEIDAYKEGYNSIELQVATCSRFGGYLGVHYDCCV